MSCTPGKIIQLTDFSPRDLPNRRFFCLSAVLLVSYSSAVPSIYVRMLVFKYSPILEKRNRNMYCSLNPVSLVILIF